MGQPTPEDAIRTRVTRAFAPMPDSLVFVRALRTPGCEMHAVRWEGADGTRWRYYWAVRQEADGTWQTQGGGGGGGESDPARTFPWVNLAGSYGPNLLQFGGSVADDGQQTVVVRLVDGDQVLAEDRVQGGIVLFLADRGVSDIETLEAELLDGEGLLLSRHTVLGCRQI